MIDKKAAIREYKMSHRPMGVFQIRNTINGKALIEASVNIPGKFNRYRLQLELGSHLNKELQEDYNSFGKDAFEFETLESLEPKIDPSYNYSEDLAALEELWIEKASLNGDSLYNVRKLTREERLAMIAARNRGKF